MTQNLKRRNREESWWVQGLHITAEVTVNGVKVAHCTVRVRVLLWSLITIPLGSCLFSFNWKHIRKWCLSIKHKIESNKWCMCQCIMHCSSISRNIYILHYLALYAWMPIVLYPRNEVEHPFALKQSMTWCSARTHKITWPHVSFGCTTVKNLHRQDNSSCSPSIHSVVKTMLRSNKHNLNAIEGRH